MPTLLEQVSTHRAEQQAGARAEYWAMVREVAADQEVDPASVIEVLDSAGKSVEQLAADADVIRQRIVLAERLHSLPESRRALADVESRIAAADQELTAARARHAQTVEPLKETRARLQSQVDKASDAADELRRTCVDAAIVQAEQRITKEVLKLRDDELRLQDDLAAKSRNSPGTTERQLTEQIKSLKQKLASPKFLPSAASPDSGAEKAELKNLQDRLAQLERNELAPRRARLAAIAKRRADIAAEQNKLSEAKLIP